MQFTVDSKQLACYGIDGVKSCLRSSAESIVCLGDKLKELNLPTGKEARLTTVHEIQSILNSLVNEYDHVERDLRAYERFLDMYDEASLEAKD